ncbi:hypothetical protein OPT61_g6666 [Boeremia exigua]|uniref:Uncharacterized protein n=1 Tax=Boeremia exigua TaxID=749465 RepID=A0ACC2I5S8_9PLEO|nr:hypothetical protein OPT61_g6666 [Boeremia exigua]
MMIFSQPPLRTSFARLLRTLSQVLAMWLLNARTRELRAFIEQVPDYAILSHTWSEEEVTFHDIGKLHALAMAGYQKIIWCCAQAVKDGFDWVWVDTCCINKESSAELTEAINSMYKWYWEAAICYAFLSDVSADSTTWNEEVRTSRWFTRGWTLQELLAPDIVEFYDKYWRILGTKSKLLTPIRSATKIQSEILLNRAAIRTASIATKFSWAAHRHTTRIEDMAYCLLGPVQVNMPMIYGEGGRAFHRLQSEIIRQTNEHTIFAWESIENDQQTLSVLAPSPRYFENCRNIQQISLIESRQSTHEITNNGLRITLPCIAVSEDRIIALLDCEHESEAIVGIWLERMRGDKWQRLPGSKLAALSATDKEDAILRDMLLVIHTTYDEPSSRKPCSAVIRSIIADQPCSVSEIAICNNQSSTSAQGALTFLEYGSFPFNVTIRDGQAASFTLSPESCNVTVVYGIRNDRAAVCLDSGPKSYRNWAEEMRVNWLGHWNQVSDYDHVLLPGIMGDIQTMVQISAKKTLVGNKVLWKLDVSVFCCSCNATHGNECVCEANARRKGVLRCINSTAPLCPCEVCIQARTEDKQIDFV